MMSELRWKKIRYTISSKVKKRGVSETVVKKVLSDINGKAVEGRFFAILGPTGSGKTSLLNVLADKIMKTKNALLEGDVTYTGKSTSSSIVNVKSSIQSRKQYQSISAYVTQDECLFTFLTVKETVLLTAKFHFSPVSEEEEAEVEQRVVNLIRSLGLEGASDTLVGSPNIRGVSGGERKRTAIAKELVSEPDILFLDEPTSGLDAFQAQSVIESLKPICNSGKIVVSVIHQPRSSIFTLFDDLLLLSEGRVMYCGPAANAVAYFAQVGYACPTHYNPGDFVLDTISLDMRSKDVEAETRQRVNYLSDAWSSYNIRTIAISAITKPAAGLQPSVGDSSVATTRGGGASAEAVAGRSLVGHAQDEGTSDTSGVDVDLEQGLSHRHPYDTEASALRAGDGEQKSNGIESKEDEVAEEDNDGDDGDAGIIGTDAEWVERQKKYQLQAQKPAGEDKKYTETTTAPKAAFPLAPVVRSYGCWRKSPAAKFFRDLVLLTWRSFVPTYRHVAALIIRTVTILIYAVVLSLVYQNTGYTQEAIQGRIGILFFITINQSFGPGISALTAFCEERRIISHELSRTSYSLTAYFLSKFFSEIPMQFVLPIIYCSVIYWSAGLNPLPERFFIFVATIVVESLCGVAFGLIIGAVSPTIVIGNALISPVLIILILFGGFYINTAVLPNGSGWVPYIDFISWSFKALAINEFKGEKFICPEGVPKESCKNTGEDVLASLSLTSYSLVVSQVALLCMLIGYLMIGFFALMVTRDRYMSLKVPTRSQEEQEKLERQKTQQYREGEDDEEDAVLSAVSKAWVTGPSMSEV